MTAKKRLVPVDQLREVFDYLKSEGIDLARCGVDIGADYVKVSPPANSNSGGSLGDYINRTSHRQKTAESR